MSKRRNGTDLDEYIQNYLSKNPDRHARYLADTFEEEDAPGAFLSALRDVARARGKSMQSLAESTSLNRESMYRMLSENGNPTFSSLTAVLDSLGFQFSVQEKKKKKPLRRA